MADPHERGVLEPPEKVPLVVNDRTVTNYYCDFVVRFGHEEWHEATGIETDVWLWSKSPLRPATETAS